jgi:hypothetical protein
MLVWYSLTLVFGGRDDSERTEASDSDLSSRTKLLGVGRDAKMWGLDRLQLHHNQRGGTDEAYTHCHPQYQHNNRRLMPGSRLPF